MKASYINRVSTMVNFTDPLDGTAIAAHFGSYEEIARDLHSQFVSLVTGRISGVDYEVKIMLMEA